LLSSNTKPIDKDENTTVQTSSLDTLNIATKLENFVVKNPDPIKESKIETKTGPKKKPKHGLSKMVLKNILIFLNI
jgi:hypothetical protein